MSFRKELLGLDTERIEEVFDDVLPLDQELFSTQTGQEFILTEVAISDGHYPAFKTIQKKLLDMAPRMISDGVINEEQLHWKLMGMTIVQLVLAGYAERELPDTLPPDL